MQGYPTKRHRMPKETIDAITDIIEHGGAAEVKIERDNYVVVELSRKVRSKARKADEE